MGVILQPIDRELKTEVKLEEGILADRGSEKGKEPLGAISEGVEIKPLAVVNDDDMMIIYLTLSRFIWGHN